jgi:error-prone DNA polymerase
MRLGLRMTKGLSEIQAQKILSARGEGYSSIETLWRRAGVPRAALEHLVKADAFLSLGLDRRQALWMVRGLDDGELPLWAAASAGLSPEPEVKLRRMSDGGEVVADYRSVGLTLRAHPVSFLRRDVERQGAVPCAALRDIRPGRRVTVAGIVLVRQRPGSANGVMFATLEDETGHANIIVWPDVFEKHRRIVLSASMIACHGRLQREGEAIHVIAERITDLSALLASVGRREGELPVPRGRGDQMTHGGGPDSRETMGRKPRDIHTPDPPLKEGIKMRTRDFR